DAARDKKRAPLGLIFGLAGGGLALVLIIVVVVLALPREQAKAPDLVRNMPGQVVRPGDGGPVVIAPKQIPEAKPIVNPAPGDGVPNEMTPDVVTQVKNATVYLRVRTPTGQVAEGSGFFAVEPGLVVTNAHVLGMLQATSRTPEHVEVVAHSGEPNELKL